MIDEFVETVQDGDGDAVDDVRKDVEHHLLQNARTVLPINARMNTNSQQALLVDGKTLQTVRHGHQQDARHDVDDNNPHEEEFPRRPTINERKQTNRLMKCFES